LPHRSLTAAAVERLKVPAKGQVEHFDKGFPGLALRLSYGGGKSFVFFYRIGGRLRRMTLGTYPALSLADAREAWRKARQDVQLGRDPAIARGGASPATAFAAVTEEWLKRDQATNKSHATVERIVKRELLPAWGHLPIAEINYDDVLRVIDSIADRGTVIMARRVHGYAHRLFVWAKGRRIITTNPMADMPKPGKEIPRDRVLTDDELAQVWRGTEELGWPFGPAFRLLILTGARREEIGRLRWSEVDGAVIKLEGTRTKSGNPHTIPLSTAGLVVLEQVPRIVNSDFVFTASGKAHISAWSTAKGRLDTLAPIASWRTHDLRRTAATGMQRLGISLQVVESILGHVAGSRAGVVGIYQRHTYDAEKRAALEAWGAHVMALVEGRKPGVVLPIWGKR
jgi:integrase